MAQVCTNLNVQSTVSNVVVELVEVYISGTTTKVTTITEGQAVDVVVWISNSGGPASSVLVEAKSGSTVIGSQTTSVPTIPVGSPTYIEFTNRQLGSAGTATVCGVVSGTGVTTNSKCINVVIQTPAANVIVERVEAYLAGTSTKVSTVTEGQNVDVVVWLSNSGGSAPSIKIDAYVGSTVLGTTTTTIPSCQPSNPVYVEFTNRNLGSAGNVSLCGAAYSGTTLLSNKCTGITINPVPSNVVIESVQFFESATSTQVTEVAQDERFDVVVWISNSGSTTGAATIDLTSNGVAFATMNVANIGHTETGSPTFVEFTNRYISNVGTFNMCASITGSGITAAQKCSSLTVSEAGPEYNLVISSGPTVTPNPCAPGDKVTISWTLKNNGPSDYLGGGYVKVFSNSNQILNYGPITPMGVNSYKVTSFYYYPTTAGTYAICVEIYP